MEPPAAASCRRRRRPLPPPLLCLLLAALCPRPGNERTSERPPAGRGDRAVPTARNLAERRPGPQVAAPARGSLLPAGPPARSPLAGAPRHLPRGLCGGGRSRPLLPSASRFASAGSGRAPVPSCPRRRRPVGRADAASPEGEAGAAPAVRGAERPAGGGGLAFPREKRRRGPSGALSAGRALPPTPPPTPSHTPTGVRADSRRGARFASRLERHVSAASRLQLRRFSRFSPPRLQGPTAARRFRAAGGSGAGRGAPGERRRCVMPGGKRRAWGGGPAVGLPVRGQPGSRAWWQRCVG